MPNTAADTKAKNKEPNLAVVPERPVRKKSLETELKLSKRKLERELAALDTKIAEFDKLKAEMDNAEATKAEIVAELDAVKADLIKELGLG